MFSSPSFFTVARLQTFFSVVLRDCSRLLRVVGSKLYDLTLAYSTLVFLERLRAFHAFQDDGQGLVLRVP